MPTVAEILAQRAPEAVQAVETQRAQEQEERQRQQAADDAVQGEVFRRLERENLARVARGEPIVESPELQRRGLTTVNRQVRKLLGTGPWQDDIMGFGGKQLPVPYGSAWYRRAERVLQEAGLERPLEEHVARMLQAGGYVYHPSWSIEANTQGDVGHYVGASALKVPVGVAEGTGSLGRSVFGAFQAAEDAAGRPEDAQRSANLARQSGRMGAKLWQWMLGYDSPAEAEQSLATIGGSDIPRDIAAGGVSIAPYLAMAPLGGGMPMATAIAGLQQFGGKYADLREMGVEPGTAAWDASLSGLVTATVTALGGKFGPEAWLSGANREVSRRTLARAFALHGAGEAAEEGADQTIQALLDGKPLQEAIQDGAYAAMLGAAIGGPFGAVHERGAKLQAAAQQQEEAGPGIDAGRAAQIAAALEEGPEAVQALLEEEARAEASAEPVSNPDELPAQVEPAPADETAAPDPKGNRVRDILARAALEDGDGTQDVDAGRQETLQLGAEEPAAPQPGAVPGVVESGDAGAATVQEADAVAVQRPDVGETSGEQHAGDVASDTPAADAGTVAPERLRIGDRVEVVPRSEGAKPLPARVLQIRRDKGKVDIAVEGARRSQTSVDIARVRKIAELPTQEQKAAPKKQAAPKKTAPKKQAAKPIEDFGAKIGGARKDLWAARAMRSSDLEQMNDREVAKLVKKDKALPAPDYAALAEQFDTQTADFVEKARAQLPPAVREVSPGAGLALVVKNIRDSIQNPKADWGRERAAQWLDAVGDVRQALSKVRSLEDVRGFLEQTWPGIIEGKGTWRGLNREHPAFAKLRLLGPRFLKAAQVSDRDLAKAMKQALDTGFPAKQEAWQRRYQVVPASRMQVQTGYRYDRGTQERIDVHRIEAERATVPAPDGDTEFVGDIGPAQAALRELQEAGKVAVLDRKRRRFVRWAADADEAAAWARAQSQQQRGSREARPQLKHVRREGEDYRQGKDVTPEQFGATFGFRGVEFGNWTNDADRQAYLNYAYDGLMDLARVTGLPPQALSLNGELALAFGARGQGAWLAHYEPTRMVVNLTKLRGAGSLAHEWAHALDDYFGRLSGDRPAAAPYASHGLTKNSAMRAELRAVWDEAIAALRQRAKTKAEVIEELDAAVARAKRNVRSWMDAARAGFAAAQGGKVPSEAQLQQWEDLAKRIEAGEGKDAFVAGRSRMGGRASTDLVEQMNALHKEVKGRQIPKDRLEGIAANALHLRGQMQQRERIAAGEEISRQRSTSFLTESRKMDADRQKAYWSERHELFARAFEAWVADQVQEQGARSDYLVAFASNESYRGNPYPEGEERQAIGEAIGKVMRTVKTEPTEQGVRLYAPERGTEPVPVRIDTARNRVKTWKDARAFLRSLQGTRPRSADGHVVDRFAVKHLTAGKTSRDLAAIEHIPEIWGRARATGPEQEDAAGRNVVLGVQQFEAPLVIDGQPVIAAITVRRIRAGDGSERYFYDQRVLTTDRSRLAAVREGPEGASTVLRGQAGSDAGIVAGEEAEATGAQRAAPAVSPGSASGTASPEGGRTSIPAGADADSTTGATEGKSRPAAVRGALKGSRTVLRGQAGSEADSVPETGAEATEGQGETPNDGRLFAPQRAPQPLSRDDGPLFTPTRPPSNDLPSIRKWALKHRADTIAKALDKAGRAKDEDLRQEYLAIAAEYEAVSPAELAAHMDEFPQHYVDAAKRGMDPVRVYRKRSELPPVLPRLRVDPLPVAADEQPESLRQTLIDLHHGLKKVDSAAPDFYIDRGLPEGAAGSYDPNNDELVLRYHNHIDSVAHEVGHWLAMSRNVLEGLPEEARPELAMFAVHGSNAKGDAFAQEGFAEYLRAWMVSPGAAVERAPALAAHLERRVGDRVWRVLRAYGDSIRRWEGGTAWQKTAAGVQQAERALKEAKRAGSALRRMGQLVARSFGIGKRRSEQRRPGVIPEDYGRGHSIGTRVAFQLADYHAPMADNYLQALLLTDYDPHAKNDWRKLVKLAAGQAGVFREMLLTHGLHDMQMRPVLHQDAETQRTAQDLRQQAAQDIIDYEQQMLAETGGDLDETEARTDAYGKERREQLRKDLAALPQGERMTLHWMLEKVLATGDRWAHVLDKAHAYGIAQRTLELVERFTEQAEQEIAERQQALLEEAADDPFRRQVAERRAEEFAEKKREDLERQLAQLTAAGGGVHSAAEVAQEAMAEIEADPDRDAILTYLERYRAMNDWTLQRLVEAQLMTPQVARRIRAQNRYYIDWHRVFGKDEGPITVKESVHGSMRTIQNPITSLIHGIWSAMARSNQNKLMTAFTTPLRLSQKRRGTKALASLGRRYSQQEVDEALARDKGKGYVDLQGEQRRLYSVSRVVPKMGEDGAPLIDPSTGQPVFDKIDEWWAFEPGTEASLEAERNLMGDHPLTMFMRGLTALQRTMITTALPFRLRVLARDNIDQWLVSETGVGGKAAKGERAQHRRSKDEYDRLYDISGANLAGWSYQGHEESLREIAGGIEDMQRQGWRLFTPGGLARAWRRFGEAAENVARKREFRNAYQDLRAKGVDEDTAVMEAAIRARELLDTAQAGYTIARMNGVALFLSARIRGGLRSTRLVRKAVMAYKNGDVATGNAYAAAVGQRMGVYAAFTLAAQWMLLGGMDDEDARAEINAPAWQTDFAQKFDLPGLPKFAVAQPYENGWAGAAFRRLANYVYAKRKGWDHEAAHAWEGWAHSGVAAIWPMEPEMTVGSLLPAIEALANYSFWTDRPIVPEYEEGREVDLRPGTKRASLLGQGVQWFAGVDARKADYLIQRYFGGWGGSATARDWDEFARRSLGMAAGYSPYQARDVNWVLEEAEKLGLGRRKMFAELRKLAGATSRAEGERRRELMDRLLDRAARLRKTLEERGEEIREAQRRRVGR